MEEFEAGSRIKSGMTKRKQPRWVMPFLRALVRTGEVRTAAEDAGIDWSTAYQRRKTHPQFAGLWRGALAAHEKFVEMEKAGEFEALKRRPSTHVRFAPDEQVQTAPGSPAAPHPLPMSFAHRAELTGGAAQLKRAGHDRWGPRKEKLFFDELAATANVKRAAKAAGVSPNAVYQRRMRDAHFKAKWAAVLETGRASIEMHLVEAANRSFEPEELETGAVEPKVSVAEAIRIVQVHGSKQQQAQLHDPFAEQAAAMSEQEVEELRERLLNKIKRLSERTRREQVEEGWTLDEEHDHMVPPGYVKAVDAEPRDSDY